MSEASSSPQESTLYAPNPAEIVRIATTATLSNMHPSARPALLDKLEHSSADWERRMAYSIPGLVWTVESNTCATGRPNAPSNIAYDTYYREFVFRQPRDERELVAIMSADSEEVFSCYRFDGLHRWTVDLLDTWWASTDVLEGWLENAISREPGPDLDDGRRVYLEYLRSEDLRSYLLDLRCFLARTRSPRWRRRPLSRGAR